MAKLIHSQSLTNVKANTSLYYLAAYTDLGRGALIFTDDGYIVARGHEYYIGTSTPTTGQGGLSIDSNGQLTVTDRNGDQIGQVTLPVFGAENGLTVSAGKVGHSTAKATSNITGASISSYILNTPTWELDTWGHVTTYTPDAGSGTHVDYITDSLAGASTTYSLLGAPLNNSTANSTYYQPKKWTGAYITTDANSNATLYVTGDMYAGGTDASHKVITSGDIGSLTGALRMKGSTGDTGSGWVAGGNGPASHSVGDVWYVSTAGTYAGLVCEVGDMLICKTDGTSANASHWTVGQTNWKVELPSSVPTIATTATTIATIGGVAIQAKVAADVNNWRPVYLDSTQKLGTEITTGNLVFKNVNNNGITIDYNSGFTFTLNAALTDYLGGIKVSKKTTGYSVTALTSGTISNNITANKYTKDLGYFGVETDKDNKAFVFIPTALGDDTEADRVYGLVTSSTSDSPFSTGSTLATYWKPAPIIDGVVYYKNTTYTSLKNPKSITFNDGNSNSISYIGDTAKTITFGTNLSLSVSGNTATLNATNTWRPIYAWTISLMATAGDTIDLILAETAGTKSLAFSSTFGYREVTHSVGGNNVTVAELDLVWAEVDGDGNITYSV